LKIPRSKPRGIFDRKEFCLFFIRSLTPQQAAENALAIAVQVLFGQMRIGPSGNPIHFFAHFA
jgi:hypothetical protein